MHEKLMSSVAGHGTGHALDGSATEFLTAFVNLIPQMLLAIGLFLVLVGAATLWETHQRRQQNALLARLDSRRVAQETYAPMRYAMHAAATCQPKTSKKTKCLKSKVPTQLSKRKSPNCKASVSIGNELQLSVCESLPLKTAN